MAEHTKC